LALIIGNRLTAISAAIVLASSLFHIEHSAYITTDVPMTFFVWGAFLFSFLYLHKEKAGYLYGALILSGLATSVKYNGGFVIIAPIAAMLVSRRKAKIYWWQWFLVPLLPSLSFILGTPFALLDFQTFSTAVNYEFFHYSAQGHGDTTIAPGLPHIVFQSKLFLSSFGKTGIILAIIGLIQLFKNQYNWILTGSLGFYFLFMTRMTVSFHRNFIVIYPLISILIGYGVVVIISYVYQKKESNKFLKWIVIIFLLIFLITRLSYAWKRSWEILQTPETRTQAILEANSIATSFEEPLIGIAFEIRFHPSDLNLLEASYLELPYLEMLQHPHEYDIIIGIGKAKGSNQPQRETADEINEAIKNIPQELQTHIGSQPLYVEIFSINPDIVIIREPEKIKTP
jgi:hypothetical protein